MSTDTQLPAPIAGATFPTDPIREELRRYDEHLREVCGLSPGTRRGRLHVVDRLLRQHFGGADVDIATLHSSDIRQFLADELEVRKTPSHAAGLAAGLQSYLRYRSTCGDSVGALTAVIALPAHWTLATLPRTLTQDEVEQLLNSFSGVRQWPKRGYAMVRCALDLGLRAGEIAGLMISDIDWRTGTVTLRGTKALRQDVLPLPVETICSTSAQPPPAPPFLFAISRRAITR